MEGLFRSLNVMAAWPFGRVAASKMLVNLPSWQRGRGAAIPNPQKLNDHISF